MPDWWDNDPIVGTATAPQQSPPPPAADDWWKSDPLADPGGSASPRAIDAPGGRVPPDILDSSNPEQYYNPAEHPIAENAAAGAIETFKGLVPRTVGQAAGFLTPLVAAPQQIGTTAGAVRDWIEGKPLDQVVAERFPESQLLAAADKTPPGSKERFAAGFNTIAQMLMAAGATRGLAHAGAAEAISTPAEPTNFQPEPGGGEINASRDTGQGQPGIGGSQEGEQPQAIVSQTQRQQSAQPIEEQAGIRSPESIGTAPPGAGAGEGPGGSGESGAGSGAQETGGSAPGQADAGTEGLAQGAAPPDRYSGTSAPLPEPAAGDTADRGAASATGSAGSGLAADTAPQTFKSFAELPDVGEPDVALPTEEQMPVSVNGSRELIRQLREHGMTAEEAAAEVTRRRNAEQQSVASNLQPGDRVVQRNQIEIDPLTGERRTVTRTWKIVDRRGNGILTAEDVSLAESPAELRPQFAHGDVSLEVGGQLNSSATLAGGEVVRLKAAAAPRPRTPSVTPGGFSESPLVQFIRDDVGGVLSRSAGKAKLGERFAQNASLWEDAPNFRSPRHNQIYNSRTGQLPDAVAAAASDAGLLPPNATATDLWNALQRESDAAHSLAAQNVAQKANIAVAGRQYRAFTAAIEKPIAGEKPIRGADLNVGDTVKIGTETLKVKDIDPDTYDVTLEDGSKFGIQHVRDDQAIYGEISRPTGATANDPFTIRTDAGGDALPAGNGPVSDQRTLRYTTARTAYDLAAERQRRAAADLRVATQLYRNKEIGDAEYLTTRQAHTDALADFDKAEAVLNKTPAPKPPKLRANETQGDIFSASSDTPFNLAGEQGIDYATRAQEAIAEAGRAAESAARAQRDQRDLFAPEVARKKAMDKAAAAEGASLQAMGIVAPGANPFIVEDVIPKLRTIGHGIAESLRQVRNIFSPTSAGADARAIAGNIRERAAELARKKEMALAHLEKASKLFNRTSNTFNLDVIDRLEHGKPMGNAGLDAYKSARKSIFDQKIAEVRAVNPDALQNLIQDYFEHIWTRESVERVRGNAAKVDPSNPWAVIFGKRPLEGPKSFLKQRSIPDTISGIALGLEPVTYNPVELDVMKLHEMDRYVMGQKIGQEEIEAGRWKFRPAGSRAEPGETQINDRIARVFAPKNWKIVDDAGNEMPGQKLLGHYWANDDVARVVNNYLSPGLSGQPVFDAMRFIGNAMNQVQLGISAFHAAFTAIDAATSTLDLGLRRVLRSGGNPGEIARGAFDIARAIAQAPVGGGLVENIWRGNKFLREYARPGTSNAELGRIVDAAIAGGARVRMDTMYKSGAWNSFLDAIRKGNYAGAALRSPFAAFELMAKPLMEYAVPRMKLGIISQNLAYELSRLPAGATRADIRTIAGRIVDSVDNRMGQMIYDNLFWNKTLKDVSMASVRSVGWNVGDIRELGGGALDAVTAPKRMLRSMIGRAGISDNPVVTMRMGYMVALPLMVGTLGAMYQYLMTGSGPGDLVDLFMPRTGRLKPDGTPERKILPTYMKDIAPLAVAYAHRGLAGLGSRTVQMAGNKLHPFLNMLYNMWTNKDFYGNAIRNENDPMVQQVKSELAFVAKQFVPFSFRGYQQTQGTTADKVQSFIGIMPTPRELTQSAAEDIASRIFAGKQSEAPRTQSAADAMAVRHDIRDRVRTHDRSAVPTALRTHEIQPAQASRILHGARQTPLQYQVDRFTPEEAMQVWAVATPAERNQIRQQLRGKMLNSKTLAPQQRAANMQALRIQ